MKNMPPPQMSGGQAQMSANPMAQGMAPPSGMDPAAMANMASMNAAQAASRAPAGGGKNAMPPQMQPPVGGGGQGGRKNQPPPQMAGMQPPGQARGKNQSPPQMAAPPIQTMGAQPQVPQAPPGGRGLSAMLGRLRGMQ